MLLFKEKSGDNKNHLDGSSNRIGFILWRSKMSVHNPSSSYWDIFLLTKLVAEQIGTAIPRATALSWLK